jgi:hypothetical protein
MLIISGSYQNYQNGAEIYHLTSGGMEGERVGGDSKSVDM